LEVFVKASVIIPTYSRALYLDYSLAAFLHQQDGDFEIVIVEDGGDERSHDIVRKYERHLDVRYIWREHRGISAARNAGLSAARADIVVFTDDCMIPGPALVRQHVETVRETDGLVTIGWKRRALTRWERGRLPMIEEDFLSLLARSPDIARRLPDEDFSLVAPEDVSLDLPRALALVDLGDDITNYADIVDAFTPSLDNFQFPWMLATTGNMCVRKQAVLDIGGFSEDFIGWGMEDTDLCYRLYRDGARFAVKRDAQTFHQIHPVGKAGLAESARVRRGELARNVRTFCEKYVNDPAVRLFWPLWLGTVDIFQANNILLDLETGARQRIPEEFAY
jgi:glycosyltransferase involved in cell wall biosynthesis